MAKQVIITRGDYGVELDVQFLDSNKQPVNLTDYSIEVQIVTPSDVLLDIVQAQISDYTNGKALIILNSTQTAEEGLYKSYWVVLDDNTQVTAQDELYYYVRAEHGGV